MVASVPLNEIPLAVTVLFRPYVLEEKVAFPVTVSTSPDTRLSAYTTDAAAFPSYVLLLAVIVTASERTRMDAVAVAVVSND